MPRLIADRNRNGAKGGEVEEREKRGEKTGTDRQKEICEKMPPPLFKRSGEQG